MTIGAVSPYAWATPPNEFSAPGPCCIANTPSCSPDVTRLTASHMWSPVRSCRTMIVRTSAAADASMIGLTGYPIRNETPSFFKMSAIAALTFTAGPPPLPVLALIEDPHVVRREHPVAELLHAVERPVVQPQVDVDAVRDVRQVLVSLPILHQGDGVAREQDRPLPRRHPHPLEARRVAGQLHELEAGGDLQVPRHLLDAVEHVEPGRPHLGDDLVRLPQRLHRRDRLLQLLALHDERGVREQLHVAAVVPVQVAQHDQVHGRRVEPRLLEPARRILRLTPPVQRVVWAGARLGPAPAVEHDGPLRAAHDP